MNGTISDKTVVLTPEQALGLLPDGDSIHVIVDATLAKLGANWARGDVLDLIAQGNRCEVGGERCRTAGHGLVVWDRKRLLFVETRDGVDWEAFECAESIPAG